MVGTGRPPPYLERWLWLSERADTLFSLFLNLLDTPPSFSLNFCLGDLDCSRLILENTLGLGLGLREHLDMCLFSCSLVLIVLDSKYRDVPEDLSKFSRAFTLFSFLLFSFSLLNFSTMIGSNWLYFLSQYSRRATPDAGPPQSCETGSFPLPTVFHTADMGWLGADYSGLLMVSIFVDPNE
ncbi:hypothetical protein Tco_1227675 [Tanacetum coccineum]